jgi:hypothetical protein
MAVTVAELVGIRESVTKSSLGMGMRCAGDAISSHRHWAAVPGTKPYPIEPSLLGIIESKNIAGSNEKPPGHPALEA